MNESEVSERTIDSEEEMIAFGEEIGRDLRPGTVLGLTGDLGAGKTHFVKGLVRGAGSSDGVTSPTFTLVHEYTAGRVPVFHFDFYRPESADEIVGIGWDEYLEEGQGIVVVEWAEKFRELLPQEAKWWTFEVLSEDRRRVREGEPS